MDNNHIQQPATPNMNMSLELFKKNLSILTPMESLQNMKNLLDKAVAAGMFKNTELVVIMYTSVEVLYNVCNSKPEPTLNQPAEKN